MLMTSPRKVDIEITPRCNLRCKYCSHFASEGDVSRELAFEEWDQFFTECGKNGVMNIHLSGGEPFIRKDILHILQSIIDNRMRFGCNTNGAYITEDVVDFIAKSNRCYVVQVSLDGHNAELHDTLRGKGSFEQAVNAVRLMQEYGIRVSIRVTIHKKNVYHLEEISDFIFNTLQLSSFGTNSVQHLGLMKENHDGIELNVQEYSYAMQVLTALNINYENRIHATAGPLADAGIWQQMVDAIDKNAAPFTGCGTLNSCGCVQSALAVRADGCYVPCNQIDGEELGYINKDSLIDVWKKSDILNRFRERKHISLSEFESCQSCAYNAYCRGGCPATMSALQGDLFLPSTIDCLKTFQEQGGVLPTINEVGISN